MLNCCSDYGDVSWAFPVQKKNARRFAYSLLATDPGVSLGSQRDVIMGVLSVLPLSSLTSRQERKINTWLLEDPTKRLCAQSDYWILRAAYLLFISQRQGHPLLATSWTDKQTMPEYFVRNTDVHGTDGDDNLYHCSRLGYMSRFPDVPLLMVISSPSRSDN